MFKKLILTGLLSFSIQSQESNKIAEFKTNQGVKCDIYEKGEKVEIVCDLVPYTKIFESCKNTFFIYPGFATDNVLCEKTAVIKGAKK